MRVPARTLTWLSIKRGARSAICNTVSARTDPSRGLTGLVGWPKCPFGFSLRIVISSVRRLPKSDCLNFLERVVALPPLVQPIFSQVLWCRETAARIPALRRFEGYRENYDEKFICGEYELSDYRKRPANVV